MGKAKYLVAILIIATLGGIYLKSPISRLLYNGNSKVLPPEYIPSSLPTKFANHLKNKNGIYLFRNVNVIPMTRDTVILNQDVLIKDGKIAQITNANMIDDRSEDWDEIDATNKFLIPGLSDMHTHINDENNLLTMICNGVLTTRNMAGLPFHLKLKKEIDFGNILGPKLYTTSPILEGPAQIWKNRKGSIKIDSLEAITGLIEQFEIQKFDFVKVYHTLSPEFYREIINSLDQNGKLKAVGHMPIDVNIYDFLKLNQYSVEHIEVSQLRKISPELSLEEKAALLGKSDKWICPTLIVHKKQNRHLIDRQQAKKYEQFVDSKTRRFWNIPLRNHDNEYELRKSLVKVMYDHKGRLLTGSDCLNPYVLPGFSLHEELAELVDCGLSEFEVLRASTMNAAIFLDEVQTSGTIEKGKNADLVLLAHNPLENINHTKEIEGVMIDGKWLHAKELDQILEAVKASYLN